MERTAGLTVGDRPSATTARPRVGAAGKGIHVGLDLYFCRRAVEADGGASRIESTHELPTVFVIELPV